MQTTPTVITLVAVLFQYLGILFQYLVVFTALIPVVIAVIFVLNDRDERSSHRDFFRYQVFLELVGIRELLQNRILVFKFIPHRFWRSMSEGDKKDILGKHDYKLLSAIHQKITNWNITYQNATVTQLNDPQCVALCDQIAHDAEQLFDTLPWLKARRTEMP